MNLLTWRMPDGRRLELFRYSGYTGAIKHTYELRIDGRPIPGEAYNRERTARAAFEKRQEA